MDFFYGDFAGTFYFLHTYKWNVHDAADKYPVCVRTYLVCSFCVDEKVKLPSDANTNIAFEVASNSGFLCSLEIFFAAYMRNDTSRNRTLGNSNENLIFGYSFSAKWREKSSARKKSNMLNGIYVRQEKTSAKKKR